MLAGQISKLLEEFGYSFLAYIEEPGDLFVADGFTPEQYKKYLFLQRKFRTREERLGSYTNSMVPLVTTISETPPTHLVPVVYSCKCQETSTSYTLYISL